MRDIKINGIKTTAKQFAYDGCHKIYLLEDEADLEKAKESGYTIYDIEALGFIYKNSCELRFINNWKLDKTYSKQYENAEITGVKKLNGDFYVLYCINALVQDKLLKFKNDEEALTKAIDYEAELHKLTFKDDDIIKNVCLYDPFDCFKEVE